MYRGISKEIKGGLFRKVCGGVWRVWGGCGEGVGRVWGGCGEGVGSVWKGCGKGVGRAWRGVWKVVGSDLQRPCREDGLRGERILPPLKVVACKSHKRNMQGDRGWWMEKGGME